MPTGREARPATRLARVTLTVGVVATALCLIAYGVGHAQRDDGADRETVGALERAPLTPGAGGPRNEGGTGGGPTGPTNDGAAAEDDGSAAPTPTDPSDPGDSSGGSSEPAGEPSTTSDLRPGRTLYSNGDSGDAVRELQARLRQIDWFDHDVTGYYGDVTAAAVRGFQAKREFPVTGEVDRRTLDRLEEMTVEPTAAELDNTVSGNSPGALDPRCERGRVLCIDKTSRTLRWVIDGRVQRTMDVRFGSQYTPTREGAFEVYRMSRDHVSSLYDTPMPYAMFFSGGQAVHYSADFAATGYNGASHGCVNVRDQSAVAWLFDQVRIGDDVIVYWS